MKKYVSKKIILSIIAIIAIILIKTNVNAAGGKADGAGLYNKSASYYFELIRAMETATGTLGVDSDINTTNYVDSSGNGIDCHMEKNTEYGTTVLLAASEYGNYSTSSSFNTGLGGSGIAGSSGYLYVSNVYSTQENGNPTTTNAVDALTRADARYVNKYYGTISDFTNRGYVIRGDALIETDNFDRYGGYHNFVNQSSPVFWRNYSYLSSYTANDGWGHSSASARAVVVCGAGL